MSYFRYFPYVEYFFGDETTPDVFQNISVYSSIFDEIKNNVAFYQDYYIEEGQRPDRLSYFLYDTPTLHWTFYLINDKIRGRGWPVTNQELIAKAQKDYSLTTLTTRTRLTDKFKVGQTIQGSTSGATAVINHRHLDLGQLVVGQLTNQFTAGETITSTNSDEELESIVLVSTGLEYLSAHHYENASGETIDIDPEVGPGALLTEITYLDRMFTQNDDLKQIRIIKPSAMPTVVASFREAVGS